MSIVGTDTPSLHCREDTGLNREEKKIFNGFLQENELSEDIFTFFQSLVGLSTQQDQFTFIKVFAEDAFVGLAMFARVQANPVYRSLNTKLRAHSFIATIGSVLRSTLYFSMHSISSPGLPRAVIYRDKNREDAVSEAILSWLKRKKDASLVIIIDSAEKSDLYSRNSFLCLPFSSDSWIDVTRYESLADYLSIHKQTRKRIAKFQRRRSVTIETLRGDVPDEIKRGMAECLECSIRYSKSLLPVQTFFNQNIFRTALFTSDRYIHFVIRVDGQIAGFSTRLSCGRNLIGIMGGYNRELFGKVPVYDFMIVSTLDYCIEHKYKRLVYGVVDNYTKARLMDSFRGLRLYAYSRNPLSRLLFRYAYRFSSAYELSRIEEALREEREKRTAKAAPGIFLRFRRECPIASVG
jgi:hypothetical protein